MRQSVEEFIDKVNKKFNGTITVIGLREPIEWTKITVTCSCKIHGIFHKTPYKLLSSTGCPECAKYLKKKLSFTEFTHRANVLHNNKYTYFDKGFNGYRSKISIKCPSHGIFTQRIAEHLTGAGCSLCGTEKGAQKHVKLYSTFLEKANKIHTNKYKYNEATYKGSTYKTLITCPIHGDFEQAVYSHLRGIGCPVCAKSGFDPSKPAILYYLKINGGQAYKIGITNRSVKERFNNSDLQLIEVLHTQYFDNGEICKETEQRILKDFKHFQYTQQPLLYNGNTELFSENILKETSWQEFLKTYL